MLHRLGGVVWRTTGEADEKIFSNGAVISTPVDLFKPAWTLLESAGESLACHLEDRTDLLAHALVVPSRFRSCSLALAGSLHEPSS